MSNLVRLVLLAVVIAVITLVVAYVDNTRRPAIELDQVVADGGTATRGEAIDTDFVVTNIGSVEAQLQAPLATCGCTATILGDTDLSPGATTTLRVVVDTTFLADGPQEKVITLPLDGGAPSTVAVRFDLRSEFAQAPRVLRLAESTASPGLYEGEVFVQQLRTARIVEATASNPRMRVNVVPMLGATIGWKITATSEGGRWDQGVIRVKTSSRFLGEFTIPVVPPSE